MAVVFLCGVANAKATEEQSELQESFRRRMTSMVEAATRAAAAAERALERSSTSTGSNEGLSAPSRALKAPDVFSGEDAMFFNSGNINLQAGCVLVIAGVQKHLTTWRRNLKLLLYPQAMLMRNR